MNYIALATTAGQTRIAAALANQQPLVITAVAVGDGAGAPVTPLVSMTGLARELWRGPPASVGRNPAAPTEVLVQVTIPPTVGPATIRELALFADGDCILIASYPATDMVAASQGAVNTIDVTIPMAVDTAANVTLQYNPAVLIPLPMLLRAPFIGIDGFVSKPPVVNPAAGALFVVAADAVGLFAHHDTQFAQFDGTAYRYAPAPLRTIVGNAADGYDYRRTATGWERIRIGDPGLVNVGSDPAVPVYVGEAEDGAHKLAKLRGAGVVTVARDAETGDVVINSPEVKGPKGDAGRDGTAGINGRDGKDGAKGESAVRGTAFATTSLTPRIDTIVPDDNTIPQLDEGVEVLTIAYTIKSATSKIRCYVDVTGMAFGEAAGVYVVGGLFDGRADALAVDMHFGPQWSDVKIAFIHEYKHTRAVGDVMTFSVRVGISTRTGYCILNAHANTSQTIGGTYFNHFGNARKTTLLVEEIE
jgi:hypothetical protein